MNPANQEFLQRAFQEAQKSGHIFPEMAACEAALESGYGRSQLAIRDNNLFGMKQHAHSVFGTVALPTNEFLDGNWVSVVAKWVSYPDWASCFADRMATLRRLASVYPHYQNALNASSATTYISEVSQTWSTDPDRAAKVLAIYDASAGNWSATQNS